MSSSASLCWLCEIPCFIRPTQIPRTSLQSHNTNSRHFIEIDWRNNILLTTITTVCCILVAGVSAGFKECAKSRAFDSTPNPSDCWPVEHEYYISWECPTYKPNNYQVQSRLHNKMILPRRRMLHIDLCLWIKRGVLLVHPLKLIKWHWMFYYMCCGNDGWGILRM